MTGIAASLVDRIREAALAAGIDPEGDGGSGLPDLLEALAPAMSPTPNRVPAVAVLATGALLAELFRLDRKTSPDDAGGPRPAADRWI
jgi:hypothetical protein